MPRASDVNIIILNEVEPLVNIYGRTAHHKTISNNNECYSSKKIHVLQNYRSSSISEMVG